MKTIATLAALATLAVAPAASAQSYVMVIGELENSTYIAYDEPLTDEQLIEQAAEKSCEKPFIRDLKGQSLYRQCLAEVRQIAAQKLEEMRSTEATQIALR